MMSWVNPKFCVNSKWGADRAKLVQGGRRVNPGCRLDNNITPVGADVKGGEAVHLALDVRSQRCYSGMRSAK